MKNQGGVRETVLELGSILFIFYPFRILRLACHLFGVDTRGHFFRVPLLLLRVVAGGLVFWWWCYPAGNQ